MCQWKTWAVKIFTCESYAVKYDLKNFHWNIKWKKRKKICETLCENFVVERRYGWLLEWGVYLLTRTSLCLWTITLYSVPVCVTAEAFSSWKCKEWKVKGGIFQCWKWSVVNERKFVATEFWPVIMLLPIYVKDANSESRIVFINDEQKFTANVWTPVICGGEKNTNSKFLRTLSVEKWPVCSEEIQPRFVSEILWQHEY